LEMCPCSGARNFGKKLRGGDISASATAGAHGARRSAPTPWTTDDSALFVMIWYPIATLIVTAAGYLVGRTLLRW